MAKTLRGKKINQIIYISLGSAIAIVVLFIILFNIFTGKKSNEMQIGKNVASTENTSEQASSSIGKTVEELANYEELYEEDAMQVQLANNDNVEEQTSNIESNEKIDNVENTNVENSSNMLDVADVDTVIELAEANASADTQATEVVQDPTFIMPVEGEIVKHYGREKLIYSDTLKEWTTHLGIDIKADKTTIVKASADGTVKSIKNDPRYGLTIVVEHQNGFSSVYANLLTAEFVVVGETVKAGQTLGTVGNSATFEILDDSHLHFEILKDGNNIDPEMYIK